MHCLAFSSTLHEIFSNSGSKSAQSFSFFIDYFRILHNALSSHPMSTSVPETLHPPPQKKPALSIYSLESMWWLEKGRVSFPTAMPLPCSSKNQLMMETEPAQDINMALGSSCVHEYSHSLHLQHSLQTSTQSFALSGPLTHSWPTVAVCTTDLKMTSIE